MTARSSRRDDILKALASMLESQPGGRITTARLAAEVGVSEAALYRHFPSKAKMFEGLIAFVEETVFSRVKVITSEQGSALQQISDILLLLLTFTQRNPGITRIFNGDALAGEQDRLHERVQQFYKRLETQLKQILREAELREGLRTRITTHATANLLMASAEGRISQFVRSDFREPPTQDWDQQWQLLAELLFREH